MNRLEQYRNYLQSIQYHQEYGDKYGDTKELIEMYERELKMKQPYKWNYKIKVKTKEGEYNYERETLENIEDILEKHPNYEMVHAVHTKKLVKEKANGRTTKTNN